MNYLCEYRHRKKVLEETSFLNNGLLDFQSETVLVTSLF